MSLVIVTKKCYLIANQIHWVTMDEFERERYGSQPKNRAWKISICYTPEDSQSQQNGISRREDRQSVQIVMDDLKVAHQLHTEIVHQIRKQMPDQLYLDQVIDSFLSGGPIDEPYSNSAKVSKPRKAKRRSKKVLRRPKASKRRARK